MSVKIPAVAASILLAGTIAVAGASQASAASVRIAPAIDNGYSMRPITDVILRHDDACTFRFQSLLLAADASTYNYAGALDKGPVTTFNGCNRFSRFWEDGSITHPIADDITTSPLVTGKYYYGAVIWTRRVGTTRWVRHGAVRSFWHTAPTPVRTSYSLPTVQLADCRLGPC